MPIETTYRTVTFGAFWLLCFWSCERNPKPQLTIEQSEIFPAVTYTLKNNPLTKEGFEVGKMLFYDLVSNIQLSDDDKENISFLKTLADYTFTKDEKF